jgi:hypothetical protein
MHVEGEFRTVKVEGWYVPAGQLVQTVFALFEEYLPATHCEHADADDA